MLLYVMRHGPAEDHAPSGRDFDRRLTPAGRALVLAMAKALRAQRGDRDLPRVLSSPRARARETAVIVRETLGPHGATVELSDALGGEAPIPGTLVASIAAAGADALLVGHQPAVEELVRALLHPAPLVISGFYTGTIVALAHADARFHLRFVLDPREVRP
jgi:phosphohistidine phosphatase